MRSVFGWSYPPGCSGPPDDYEAGYDCVAFPSRAVKKVRKPDARCRICNRPLTGESATYQAWKDYEQRTFGADYTCLPGQCAIEPLIEPGPPEYDPWADWDDDSQSPFENPQGSATTAHVPEPESQSDLGLGSSSQQNNNALESGVSDTGHVTAKE